MEQKRFLLALILSAGILFAWSYFFSPSSSQPENSNATVPQTAVVPSVPSPNADTVATPQQSPPPQIETAMPASAIPREEPIVITGPKLLTIFVAACVLALIARMKKKRIENLRLKKGVFYHFLKHSLEFLTILIIATLIYTVLWITVLIAANHATLRFYCGWKHRSRRSKPFMAVTSS